MPNRNPSTDSPLKDKAATVAEQIADRASQARESMSDAARAAAGKLDEGRATAAEGLENAASSVRETADDLPGGAAVKDFAQAAADRLSTTADYMRNHDVQRMAADVEALVKKNPGPALVLAAAFGFLLGRALTRE